MSLSPLSSIAIMRSTISCMSELIGIEAFDACFETMDFFPLLVSRKCHCKVENGYAAYHGNNEIKIAFMSIASRIVLARDTKTNLSLRLLTMMRFAQQKLCLRIATRMFRYTTQSGLVTQSHIKFESHDDVGVADESRYAC